MVDARSDVYSLGAVLYFMVTGTVVFPHLTITESVLAHAARAPEPPLGERVADHLPVPLEHRPRQRSWRIVAKRAVLASGAIERGIAFAGNDLPGVMLGSAVRSYLNRFGVAPGRRAVVFTASDDGWATARDLAVAGVAVAAVVDPRKDRIETWGVGPWPAGSSESRLRGRRRRRCCGAD